MKYFKDSISKTGHLLKRHGFLLFSLCFLVISFYLLQDYGLGFDSPKNFREGQINLDYLLTGHAPAPHDQITLRYQIHGSFFFMAGNALKRLLSDRLGWLNPVSATHSFLPVLVFFFMNFFYGSLKKKAGAFAAFLTCALLLTYPHFFGHSFYNIKDIPLCVFFSIAVLSFYDWAVSGSQKTRCLYGAFTAWGAALLSKVYAIIVPGIFLLWFAALKLSKVPLTGDAEAAGKNRPDRKRAVFHCCLGGMIVAVLIAIFFMPSFYSITEKMNFLQRKSDIGRKLFEHVQWGLGPLIQILFVTPLLTLIMTAAGLLGMFLKKTKKSLDLLMGAWLGGVILLACTPLFPTYNGIRLFMVFLPPFCFFAAQGILDAANLIEKKLPFKIRAAWFLGPAVIALQISGIVATHPYETAYYNFLAGGLRGAQQRNLPDANDYWLTSYREGASWVNKHAPLNACLLVPNADGMLLIDFYSLRKDLRYDFVRGSTLPRNSFLLINASTASWVNLSPDRRKEIKREMGLMIKAHEIKRQGGEILTIYYKP